MFTENMYSLIQIDAFRIGGIILFFTPMRSDCESVLPLVLLR